MYKEIKKNIYKPILMTAALISLMCGLFSAFGIEEYNKTIFISSSFFNFVIFIMFQTADSARRKKIIYSLCFISFAVFIIFYPLFLRSIREILNNDFFGYSYKNTIDGRVFMVYIIFVISMLENVFYAGRINISIVLLPLITYLILIITGFLPDTFFMVLVIMLCAAYFAMPTDKKVGSSPFIMASIVIVIGVVYVILTIVYPVSKNSKPTFIARLQETIIEMFSSPETPEPGTPSDIARGGINGGKLGQYDRVEYTNTLMLTIKTGFKGPVYLKGYVGSVYEDNSWRELTQNEYGEYARLFINARDDDVHFSTQTSNLLTIIDYDDNLKGYFTANDNNYLANVLRRGYSVKYEESPITYCYLPYGSLYYMSKTSSYDGYYIDNDKSSLSSLQYLVSDTDYTVYSKMLAEYQGNNEKLLKYIEYEKQYRKFVYDKYTTLGNSEKAIINNIQDELPAYEDDTQYINALKKYFSDNYTYTLAPGKTGEDEDFISKFVTNKKGYCTHFASAAVVMLRSQGIPARYVEGYYKLVNEESSREVNKQIVKRTCGSITGTDSYNEYIVEITDASAHAWVEIYKDGYGWVPYEFTPSSTYTDTETPDNYSDNIVIEDDIVAEDNIESDYSDYSYSSDKDNTTVNRRLFYLLLIIIILFIVIIIPERLSYVTIRKTLNPAETYTPMQIKKNAIKLYKYYEKMCRFFGIKRNLSMSYTDFAQYTMEKIIYFGNTDVSPLVKCAQKAAFGCTDIEYNELLTAIEAVKSIRASVLKGLTLPQKLLFIYFWHL